MKLDNGRLYTKLPNTKAGFVLSNGWLYACIGYVTEEAPPVTEKSSSDSGTGADVLSQAEAILASLDSGSGTDLAQLASLLTALDSGIGTDTSQLQALHQVLDSGVGTELSTVIGAILASDIATGLDKATLEAVLTGVDSGVGLDEATLTIIGQILKLLVLAKAYRLLQVQAKPHLNVKVEARHGN